MNYSLSWKEKLVLNVLKKVFLRIFFLSIALVILGLFIVSLLKEPIYRSTSKLVQNDNNYGLVTSYGKFVDSTDFKKKLNSAINKNKDWRNYENKANYTVEFLQEDKSPFFILNVQSNSESYTKYLASLIPQLFKDNIGKYLTGTNISIVSRSSKPTLVSQTKGLVKRGIFIWVGLFVVLTAISLGWRIFVGKVKNNNYLSQYLQLPKLGEIDLTKYGREETKYRGRN